MTAITAEPSQDDDLKDRDGRAGSLALLRRIGEDLDQDESLIVSRGGTVWPSAEQPLTWELGEQEGSHLGTPTAGPARAGRSTARQGQRTTSDTTAGSSARAAASLLRQLGVREWVVEDIVGAGAAYPQLLVRPAPSILWLEMTFYPLKGYPRGAFLMVGYPLDALLPVQAWAWWTDGLWIGPRHTNYGNGSVCAYEPTDGTWSRGRPLVSLLDLIATWVVRHIHLLELRRWPGAQALHTAHERLSQTLPGERCGCDAARLYETCHMRVDLASSPEAVEHEFRSRFPAPWRCPPRSRAECERELARMAAAHGAQLLPAARILDSPRHQWANLNAEILRRFRVSLGTNS
jgi:hypothetical protein